MRRAPARPSQPLPREKGPPFFGRRPRTSVSRPLTSRKGPLTEDRGPSTTNKGPRTVGSGPLPKEKARGQKTTVLDPETEVLRSRSADRFQREKAALSTSQVR